MIKLITNTSNFETEIVSNIRLVTFGFYSPILYSCEAKCMLLRYYPFPRCLLVGFWYRERFLMYHVELLRFHTLGTRA